MGAPATVGRQAMILMLWDPKSQHQWPLMSGLFLPSGAANLWWKVCVDFGTRKARRAADAADVTSTARELKEL